MTRRAWAALGGGLWLVAFLHTATYGVGIADEAWFLRVVDRVAAGDALYGDVFFGSTPLAVWVALGPVALLGSELLVAKALAAAILSASGLAVAAAARSLGAGRAVAVVAAVLAVVVPGLRFAGPYNSLSIGLALWALVALLRWEPDGGSRRPIVAAGALAGLALATKHNVGALALLALAAAILVRGGLPALRRVGPPVALAAAVAAALPFLPVLLTGSLDRFVEYGVTAKGTYTDRAGVSLLDGMEEGIVGWRDVTGLQSFEQALLQAGFPALPVVAAALALAAARARDREMRGRLVATGLFAAAIVGNLYPRADAPHLGVTVPAIVLALVISWHHLLPRGPARRLTAVPAVALAALLVVASLAEPPVRLVGGSAVLADVPHFRGVLVAPGEHEQMRAEGRRLAEARRREGPILTLGSNAAYAQLLGGLESVTPYDYPLVTAFGHDGEEETARAVRSGRVTAACITTSEKGLEARRLEAAVRDTLREQADLGLCRLYTR